MFELARIGLPVALVGIGADPAPGAPGCCRSGGRRGAQFEEDVREYVIQQRVAPGGPLDGRTVDEAGLRHLEGVFLAEIERDGETDGARGAHHACCTATTGWPSWAGWTWSGTCSRSRGLLAEEQKHAEPFSDTAHTFFEVVVSPASSLAGKTLREADFRSRFQAAVLAIHRAGARVNAKLGRVESRRETRCWC